jgi:hypothetical protein
VFVTALTAIVLPACYRTGITTCNQEDEDLAPLSGRTVNGRTGEPLANVHVFVELCGRYTENPNPAKGHPNYRHGAVTDKDGKFTLLVPKGEVGLHTFKPYFQYGTLYVEDSTAANVIVPMEPNADRPDPQPPEGAPEVCANLSEACSKCPPSELIQRCTDAVGRSDAAACTAIASDPALGSCNGRTPPLRPVLSRLAVNIERARPGQLLEFSMTVTSDPKDPLSEEVLLLQPDTTDARAFDPPVRGAQAIGFADGTWRTRMPAPSKPGVYRYYASVSSEGCVTGVGEARLLANGAPVFDIDRRPLREQPFVSVVVE